MTIATVPWSTAEELLAEVTALESSNRAACADLDQLRRLPDSVVADMVRLGVYRLAIPRQFDGFEVDPLAQTRVVEELSRHDGSIGWCAMISIAASYAGGFFPDDPGKAWFSDPRFCIAGQIAPNGRAQRVDGGYVVSGRYAFGSGSDHASLMLAGCVVFDGDTPVQRPKGGPATIVAAFPKASCTIVDTWHTTGLVGTASNDYVVEGLFVPEHHTYDSLGPARHEGDLYRYPPLFLCSHIGVPLGIARAAIETVMGLTDHKDLFPGAHRTNTPGRLLRDDSRAQEAIARAEGMLGAARAYAYGNLGEIWDALLAGGTPSRRQRALYRIMMTQVHEMGREVVTAMYNTASGSAIYRSSPLDRQLRDIHTACQHRMVNQKIYQPAGRVLLGMPSNDPFV